MKAIEMQEYTREGTVSRMAMDYESKLYLAKKRASIADGIADADLQDLVALAPLAWCKGQEYDQSILERIISLAYVHAYTYEKALSHAYKSIIWTVRHTRALASKRNLSMLDALEYVESQEDARYSANNIGTLIESLNLDIQVKRENDFIGLTGEQARRRNVFERGLAARRVEMTEDIKRKEESENPEAMVIAEDTAREYVGKVYNSLRSDAKERLHAIARIMKRSKSAKYLARTDINLFFNRLYNKALIDNHTSDATRALTQGDFVYLMLKYI